MKECSHKRCFQEHDTKYKQCPECRDIQKIYVRSQRNSKIKRIMDLCEKNKNIPVCKEILKLVGG